MLTNANRRAPGVPFVLPTTTSGDEDADDDWNSTCRCRLLAATVPPLLRVCCVSENASRSAACNCSGWENLLPIISAIQRCIHFTRARAREVRKVRDRQTHYEKLTHARERRQRESDAGRREKTSRARIGER